MVVRKFAVTVLREILSVILKCIHTSTSLFPLIPFCKFIKGLLVNIKKSKEGESRIGISAFKLREEGGIETGGVSAGKGNRHPSVLRLLLVFVLCFISMCILVAGTGLRNFVVQSLNNLLVTRSRQE